MSDYIIRIIPGDPFCCIPGEELCRLAGHLGSMIKADKIKAVTYEAPAFIDCGSNLEKIECPLCGSLLDFDWWGEAMSAAAENEFSDLSVSLPCCGGKSSLNDLRYDFPCGFACAEISILNPPDEPGEECLRYIRDRFGTAVRVIRSHM